MTMTINASATLALVCFVLKSQSTESVVNTVAIGGTGFGRAVRYVQSYVLTIDRVPTTFYISTEIWYLYSPPSGSQTVTVTYTHSGTGQGSFSSWLGTASSGTPGTSSGAGNSAAPSASVTPDVSNSLIVACVGSTQSPTIAGWTNLMGGAGYSADWELGTGTVSATYSQTSGYWGECIASFSPVAAPASARASCSQLFGF